MAMYNSTRQMPGGPAPYASSTTQQPFNQQVAPNAPPPIKPTARPTTQMSTAISGQPPPTATAPTAGAKPTGSFGFGQNTAQTGAPGTLDFSGLQYTPPMAAQTNFAQKLDDAQQARAQGLGLNADLFTTGAGENHAPGAYDPIDYQSELVDPQLKSMYDDLFGYTEKGMEDLYGRHEAGLSDALRGAQDVMSNAGRRASELAAGMGLSAGGGGAQSMMAQAALTGAAADRDARMAWLKDNINLRSGGLDKLAGIKGSLVDRAGGESDARGAYERAGGLLEKQFNLESERDPEDGLPLSDGFYDEGATPTEKLQNKETYDKFVVDNKVGDEIVSSGPTLSLPPSLASMYPNMDVGTAIDRILDDGLPDPELSNAVWVKDSNGTWMRVQHFGDRVIFTSYKSRPPWAGDEPEEEDK